MRDAAAWLVIGALSVAGIGLEPAQARPFTYAYKSKYATVDFSWSAEAAAIPKLVERLRTELARERAATIRGGKEEVALREGLVDPPVGWESSTKITAAGQTPRLLSLNRLYWAFTGGAHGNGDTKGLLWDRKLGKEISFASLFSSASSYRRLLRTPYCRALDEERVKKRGGDGKLNYSGFDSCPKFSDLAMIPADSRRGGGFGTIHLIAAPYLAGPYSEGEYEVGLPVTARLIRSIKPEYRSSFEAQRQ